MIAGKNEFGNTIFVGHRVLYISDNYKRVEDGKVEFLTCHPDGTIKYSIIHGKYKTVLRGANIYPFCEAGKDIKVGEPVMYKHYAYEFRFAIVKKISEEFDSVVLSSPYPTLLYDTRSRQCTGEAIARLGDVYAGESVTYNYNNYWKEQLRIVFEKE